MTTENVITEATETTETQEVSYKEIASKYLQTAQAVRNMKQAQEGMTLLGKEKRRRRRQPREIIRYFIAPLSVALEYPEGSREAQVVFLEFPERGMKGFDLQCFRKELQGINPLLTVRKCRMPWWDWAENFEIVMEVAI